MVEQRNEYSWRALRNPFQSITDSPERALQRVSGRSADIREIITGGTGAIILASAPMMGKTSLLRFLQRGPGGWSWRNEIEDLRDVIDLDRVHFLHVDLKPLEDIDNIDELIVPFIQQCIHALQLVQPAGEFVGLKGLRELLRSMMRHDKGALYFLTLDSIERLQRPGMTIPSIISKDRTPQQRSLTMFNHSGALHLLVDLMDEFNQLGVILSLESRPLPRISDQFTWMSSDLARFRTLILQTFTVEDTRRILEQSPASFGTEWEQRFTNAGGTTLFSESEQAWLYQQAGTHPYLLQQSCYHAFELKQHHATRFGYWQELAEHDRAQVIELINERVSTFLDRTWERINEALENADSETGERFRTFIKKHSQKCASDKIESIIWNQLGKELHFILRNEGIVRYDPFTPIYYPGALCMNFLAQKVQEMNSELDIQSGSQIARETPLLTPPGQKMLRITIPGQEVCTVPLSDLEYRLIKKLMQHPKECSEADLMQAAWGRKIDRSVFTQRMHHLRKKLRRFTDDEDIIENRYGGIYLLNHAEWLEL
jgi:hypothetical protein